jgi:hypothetical protein
LKAFKFPLQKALELRQMQLEMEEANFQRAAMILAAVDRERDALLAAAAEAEAQVRAEPVVPGQDLASLGAYRRHTKTEEKRIAARRMECVKAMEVRRAAMLEARRAVRLLERLKERRLAEWTAGANKELEELASESFLGQMAARARQQQDR